MRPRLAPLVRLEARRALVRCALPTLVLALLVLVVPVEGSTQAADRHRLWTLALLVLVPLTVGHAAARVTRWRRGEFEWLGARPVAPTAALVATWLGTTLVAWAALGALVGLTWLTSPAATTPRLLKVARHPTSLHLPAGSNERLALAGFEGGSSLRVRVLPTLGGASPTTTCELRLERGGESRAARARVVARTWVEAEVPPGDGPLVATLTNVGEGDLGRLDGASVELWGGRHDAREAATHLAARAALALAAAAALALGLGAWVTTGSAAGLVLVAWLLTNVGAPDVVGLGAAFDALDEGRLPRALGGAPGLGALAATAVGIALARAGLFGKRVDA